MSLEMQIEAILFYKAEPVKKKFLIDFLNVSDTEIDAAIAKLTTALEGHAMCIVTTDTEVQLVTAAHVNDTVEAIRKDELCGDIGKAGAETLAIILYRGPLSRIEVDRIRGVNSTFIIRNLLIRGLVERRPHPTDSRSFIYAITPSLLNHLGIQRREELPEFGDVMNALDTFEKEADAAEMPSLVQP